MKGNDIDGDPVTFSTTSNPTHGQLVSFNPSTGVITYTPNSDYTGEDSFSFQVIDNHNARSNTAQVSLVVRPASSSSTETPSESSASPPPSESPSQQSTGSDVTTTPSENTSPPETTTENPPTSRTDYSNICAKLQPVLIPSCSTLVSANGSLTSDGTHAMHCIRNGILLGGAATLYGVPLSIILKGLSLLAAPQDVVM